MNNKHKDLIGFTISRKVFLSLVIVIFSLLFCLLSSCASYPMRGEYANKAIPIAEQSILTSDKVVWGAYIVAIDGKAVPDLQFRGVDDYYVLSPGEHQITLEYQRTDASGSFRVYMLGHNEGTDTTISSTNRFTFTFNFLPGRYYEVVGADSLQFPGIIPQNTLAYGLIDFTTTELNIVWSTNNEMAKQFEKKKWGSTYNLQRGLIQRSISSNKGYF